MNGSISRLYSIATVIFMTAAIFFVVPASGASQTQTEELLRLPQAPPATASADKIYISSYFEPSLVVEPSRRGRWQELTDTLGYIHKNVNIYASTSRYDRFDSKDYTANAGAYINLTDSYAHIEAGFGWDIDYIYRYQAIAEYAHKIYNGLYLQVGYNYRNYKTSDTHLIYPGLIYYFGDNYISAQYGGGFIAGRDTAHLDPVKGDFALNKYMHVDLGGAYGERLYDISGLDARDELGYIVFGGTTFIINESVKARVGCSYSHEKPKFIKRSLDLSLNLKF